MQVVTVLTTGPDTWFVEITSSLGRWFQPIIGEFFQRPWKAKSNISSGTQGEKMSSPSLFCDLVSAQKQMLIILGSKWTWRAILKKNTINQSNDGGLLSVSQFAVWSDEILGPEPMSEPATGLGWGVALFVLLSVDLSRTWAGKHFIKGSCSWECIILIMTPPFCSNDTTSSFCWNVFFSQTWQLHSQPPGVNNMPNNYVTVFGLPCKKVSARSPAVLQYANGKRLMTENQILWSWAKQSEWRL